RELRHGGRGERGPEHDRAVEAHPRRRVPLPADPAAARGLALGDDRRALGRARARQLARHALGRVDLLEPVHAPPRAAEVRRELGGAEAVGLRGERVAAGPAPLDTVAPAPQRPDPLPHRRARAAEAAGQLLAGERAARGAEPGDDPLLDRHGSGSSFRLRSAAGAECVSAPTATSWTPSAERAGTCSCVTPPETSSATRPATRRPPLAIVSARMVSRRIRPAPPATP